MILFMQLMGSSKSDIWNKDQGSHLSKSWCCSPEEESFFANLWLCLCIFTGWEKAHHSTEGDLHALNPVIHMLVTSKKTPSLKPLDYCLTELLCTTMLTRLATQLHMAWRSLLNLDSYYVQWTFSLCRVGWIPTVVFLRNQNLFSFSWNFDSIKLVDNFF